MLTLSEVKGMEKITSNKLLAYLSRGGRMWMGDVKFDNSYPIGGETLIFPWDIRPVHREHVSRVLFEQPSSSYSLQFDYANNKVRVLQPGTPLIVEEIQTITTHVGQLKHKPFYIIAIEVTAGGTTGPFKVIPTGEVPLTVECAVDFPTGGLTFVDTDAVTAVRVTYIPLHESGPFSAGNLVIDEVVVAAAAKKALANQAAMVQYVWDDTDGVIAVLEPVGEAPTATHNAVIDIDAGSNDTNIDSHADDEANSLKVTYIKYSAFPPWCQLGDGDLTLATEIYGFTVNHYHMLAIPGLGVAVVGEVGDTSNVELIWSGPSASLGAGVPTWDPVLNQWNTNEGTALVTLSMPIVLLDPKINGQHLMEVPRTTDLSALVAKTMAWRIK